MSRDWMFLARRAYDLHRAQEIKRGRREGPVPTWDELPQAERDRFADNMRRCFAQYEAGR